MKKLEHIQDYKGEAIMVWRVTAGRLKGTRYCSYGSREFNTLMEAKAAVDAIGAHYTKPQTVGKCRRCGGTVTEARDGYIGCETCGEEHTL